MVLEAGLKLTYQEALDNYGSRYYVRRAVANGELYPISRNLYTTDRNETADTLSAVCKLHSDAVITGVTALYLHGLIDTPSSGIELATKRGGTKISDSRITQRFVPEKILFLGRSSIEHDGETVAIYDLERMLLELIRMRNKMPYDMYREAIQSFRRRADELDIYKLRDYAESMPHGAAHLEMVMKEVF